MKLIQKTTIQQNIESIESAANTAINATVAAVHALNNSHSVFWSLPDEELVELLQYLLNEGKLQEIFNEHYVAAVNLNQILDGGEHGGVRAIASVGRAFEVDEFGTVTLVYPPIEEPIVDPEPVEEPPIDPQIENPI